MPQTFLAFVLRCKTPWAGVNKDPNNYRIAPLCEKVSERIAPKLIFSGFKYWNPTMENNYQGSYQNGNSREVEFQRLTQNIGTNIQKLLQNVSSIQRMIAQIGTPQDNQQLQNQVKF